VAIDPLLNTHRLRINTLALGAHLPTSEPFREFVEAAGLMSYGQISLTYTGAPAILLTRS